MAEISSIKSQRERLQIIFFLYGNYFSFESLDTLMKDTYLYSDDEIVKEIRADNMIAFDFFYKKYCRRVYKFGYSILKSDIESEDLVQNVFLALWENRNKIEKGSSIKSYLFTITYNSAITLIRKKASEAQFCDYLKTLREINEEPVNTQLEFQELSSRVEEIVEGLPRRQKEVYLLHRVEGLKYSDIAERLNISVNTIENHMSIALKTIRSKLGNYSMRVVLFGFIFI
jgi:RNA polymerase sigma-70 factor (family 1)